MDRCPRFGWGPGLRWPYNSLDVTSGNVSCPLVFLSLSIFMRQNTLHSTNRYSFYFNFHLFPLPLSVHFSLPHLTSRNNLACSKCDHFESEVLVVASHCCGITNVIPAVTAHARVEFNMADLEQLIDFNN